MMNYKDIIKALECCHKDDCDNCPNDFGNCYANLAGYALDLIKRQRSEIEKLERAVSHLEDYANGVADKVKAEAIKEFEKLVTRRLNSNTSRGAYLLNIMNEVAKEMLGKEDEGE